MTTAAIEIIENRNSIVHIVTKLRIGPFAVRIPAEVIYFVFPSTSRPARGQTSLLFNGYRDSFPGPRWPKREVHKSSLSRYEVTSEWSYTSTRPYTVSWREQRKITFVNHSGISTKAIQTVRVFRRFVQTVCILIRTATLEVGRDSSVGIATHYGLNRLGIESWWGRDFPHPSIPPLGPSQPLYNRHRVSFPGVKRSEHGVDHPPHLEPRSEYSCLSSPSLGLHGLF